MDGFGRATQHPVAIRLDSIGKVKAEITNPLSAVKESRIVSVVVDQARFY
jgi:hypothetical protein